MLKHIAREHGPWCIPFYEPNCWPSPSFGRYVAIDLDANNRHVIQHSRERFEQAHPGEPIPSRPPLGWGVCRQGFGLQNFPPLNEPSAKSLAKALNDSIPIGRAESNRETEERLANVTARELIPY